MKFDNIIPLCYDSSREFMFEDKVLFTKIPKFNLINELDDIHKKIFFLRTLLRYKNIEMFDTIYNEKNKNEFECLYNKIINGEQNLYVIIFRTFELNKDFLDDFIHLLVFHNSKSKILFISGNPNISFDSNDNFIFKYIKCDNNEENQITKNIYDFEKQVKSFLSDFLQKSFY
jgi:hypothetical protein